MIVTSLLCCLHASLFLHFGTSTLHILRNRIVSLFFIVPTHVFMHAWAPLPPTPWALPLLCNKRYNSCTQIEEVSQFTLLCTCEDTKILSVKDHMCKEKELIHWNVKVSTCGNLVSHWNWIKREKDDGEISRVTVAEYFTYLEGFAGTEALADYMYAYV